MGVVRKVSNWYFRRRMLPYWAILMADTAIVLVSVIFTYWIGSDTEFTYVHRTVLLRSALVYSILSWVGAKCFRTYSGVLRFSSFMDLLKVAAANLVNLVLTSTVSGFSLVYGTGALGALNPLQLLMAFILATLLMWGLRVSVKLLYDVTKDDTRALRALVFGSMSEAVGIISARRHRRSSTCGASSPRISGSWASGCWT